jgi:hypothetical protein
MMRNTATDPATAEFCTCALTGVGDVPNSLNRPAFVM